MTADELRVGDVLPGYGEIKCIIQDDKDQWRIRVLTPGWLLRMRKSDPVAILATTNKENDR